MSRAAPPEVGSGRQGLIPDGTEKKKLARQDNDSFPSFASTYSPLLFQRCALGLIRPFQCAGCSRIALDALGRMGKHEWLCESCADGKGCT